MKIKKIALSCILGLFSPAIIFSQESDSTCIVSIAENILKQPLGQFTGIRSKNIYTDTNDIRNKEDVAFASPLSEWHYTSGVLDLSMIHLGEYLKVNKYIEYSKRHVSFGFDNYPYFKKTFRNDREHWKWPLGQLWNIKELDDCGAMGAAVIEVYGLDKKKKYEEYIQKVAEHIMKNQTRLEDGTLCRTFPRKMTLWADDVYMSVSFLSQMGKLTGEIKYFDEAAKQIFQLANYLWCPEKQLFYHCYYTDLKRNGVAFWGRANGWFTVATAMLIEAVPANYSKRADLISLLERQIVGFSRYQDKNGMWKQLLDKQDSYEETSVTSMFVYGIAKAINKHWISGSYKGIAERGWKALKDYQITKDGHLKNVCVGTGISDDLPSYYNRPAKEDDPHGLGMVIEAGIEMMKLNKSIKI